MTKKLMTILILGGVVTAHPSWGATENCNRENFSHEQLRDPYSVSSVTLEKYSSQEAENFAQIIEKKATEKSNSYFHPCLSDTKSCFGQDNAWDYSKEMIQDHFGHNLRLNGTMSAKQFASWPATDLYYAHRTQIGYICSWGGNLKAYCEKRCFLGVVNLPSHD